MKCPTGLDQGVMKPWILPLAMADGDRLQEHTLMAVPGANFPSLTSLLFNAAAPSIYHFSYHFLYSFLASV